MHWIERVPWERIILGVAVIWGFVGVLSWMAQNEVPEGNREIVLSMVAVLGTGLGAVIGSVFRANVGDEQKNRTIATLSAAVTAPQPETIHGSGGSDQQAGGGSGLAEVPAPVEPIRDALDLPDLPPSQR